ncbi:MAG TPA: thioesterase family protein [Vicinamibacteria bacterium]
MGEARPFRFVHPVEVRFRDLDAIGHVNNAVYLTYLESARLAWWRQVSGRERYDMMLARAEVDYRSPVVFGESLAVGVRCASIKRSSFVLELEVRERETGRLVAEARKVCVHFDHGAGRSAPLPADLRARFRAQDPELVEQE